MKVPTSMRTRVRADRAGCMAVARVLQAYLDGEVDADTASKVGTHLEDCRRCGMKAGTYRAIKASLARRDTMDQLTRRRLEDFASRVAEQYPGA